MREIDDFDTPTVKKSYVQFIASTCIIMVFVAAIATMIPFMLELSTSIQEDRIEYNSFSTECKHNGGVIFSSSSGNYCIYGKMVKM